jgi:hypothetical protein
MRSSTKLRNLVEQLGAYCNGLIAAPHFFATVHAADHIFRTLYEISGEVERCVKTAKEAKPPHPRSDKGRRRKSLHMFPVAQSELQQEGQLPSLEGQPFKNMTIADATRVLLEERGVLHGLEIERLLIQGGYPTTSKHFQSTMVVAFQRDGGFENLGRNRWRLQGRVSLESEPADEEGEGEGTAHEIKSDHLHR